MAHTVKSLFDFVFRLDYEKRYGPKAFDLLEQRYHNNPSVLLAPEGTDDWRSLSAWKAELVPLSESELAEARAKEALDSEPPRGINPAHLLKPASAIKRRNAAALGIELPANATRGEADALIAEAKLKNQVEMLRANGAVIPEPVSETWVWQAAAAFEAVLDDLEEIAGFGFTPPPLTNWSIDDAKRYSHAVWMFLSVAKDSEWIYRSMKDDGEIKKIPARAKIKASFPELFDAILAGRFTEQTADYLWLASVAESKP